MDPAKERLTMVSVSLVGLATIATSIGGCVTSMSLAAQLAETDRRATRLTRQVEALEKEASVRALLKARDGK